jgi:hypothetical protein
MVQQLPVLADQIQRWADSGDPGFAKLVGWNVPDRLREESILIRQQRSELAKGADRESATIP